MKTRVLEHFVGGNHPKTTDRYMYHIIAGSWCYHYIYEFIVAVDVFKFLLELSNWLNTRSSINKIVMARCMMGAATLLCVVYVLTISYTGKSMVPKMHQTTQIFTLSLVKMPREIYNILSLAVVMVILVRYCDGCTMKHHHLLHWLN